MIKLPKAIRHQNLPKYHQMVQNKRTGYTKLVTVEKAIELVLGKLYFGTRTKTTKDEYKVI